MKQSEVLSKQIQYYSYVIGTILFLIFGKLIGNNGLFYMAIGIEVLALFGAILSNGISGSFSKLLRYRRKRNQLQNVKAVKIRVTFVCLFFSIICSILLFICADKIALGIFHTKRAALIIRILAPLLPIHTMQALFCGYFQSFSVHMPIAVSCILRQVLFWISGNLLSGNRLDYGQKVAALLKNDDYVGLYGAIGLCIALLITEIIITFSFLLFYLLSDKSADKIQFDRGLHKTESVGYTIRDLTLLNMPSAINGMIRRGFILIPFLLCIQAGVAGLYYGKLFVILSIPILLLCARFILLYSRMLSLIRNRDNRMTRDFIQTGIQYTWSVGLLMATLIAVLAPQFVNTFFSEDILLISCLQKGAVLVLIIPLLIYFSMIHIAHSRKFEYTIILIITLIIHGILSKIMYHKEGNPESLLGAAIISLVIGLLLLGVLTIFQYGIRLEYVPVFLLPLICTGVTGIIVLLVAKYMTPHIGNQISMIIGTILGIVLYIASLGMCRVFSDLEMERIFGKFGRKLFSFVFR